MPKSEESTISVNLGQAELAAAVASLGHLLHSCQALGFEDPKKPSALFRDTKALHIKLVSLGRRKFPSVFVDELDGK